MISADFGTGEIVWSFLWFFLFTLWFALLVFVCFDRLVLREATASSPATALCALALCLVRVEGILWVGVIAAIVPALPVAET